MSSIPLTTTPSRFASTDLVSIAPSGLVVIPWGPAPFVVDPARPISGMAVDPAIGAELAGDPVDPDEAGPCVSRGVGTSDAAAPPCGVRLDDGSSGTTGVAPDVGRELGRLAAVGCGDGSEPGLLVAVGTGDGWRPADALGLAVGGDAVGGDAG